MGDGRHVGLQERWRVALQVGHATDEAAPQACIVATCAQGRQAAVKPMVCGVPCPLLQARVPCSAGHAADKVSTGLLWAMLWGCWQQAAVSRSLRLPTAAACSASLDSVGIAPPGARHISECVPHQLAGGEHRPDGVAFADKTVPEKYRAAPVQHRASAPQGSASTTQGSIV